MAEIERVNVAKAIRKEMPHLECAVWDLEPFMKGFHNWRKNIVFVECEKIAMEQLSTYLAHEFKSAVFYAGIRKFKSLGLLMEEFKGNIVIVGRKGFHDTVEDKELGVLMPSLEERTMDILAFALREEIPVGIDEAANAVAYVIKINAASISKMHRYAMKKYVDWLFKIILYGLSKRGEVGGLDPRYLKIGKRYLNAVKEVEKRE